MVLPLLQMLLLFQGSKTFEDFEIEKIRAYQGLRTFHEEIEMTTKSKSGKPAVIHRSTFMDGDRIHSTINLPDGSAMESIVDGATCWLILRAQKQYVETKFAPDAKTDPKLHLLKADANSFNFTCSTGEPVKFAGNPSPKLVSFGTVHEGKETLRKAVFKATGHSGHVIYISEWFLPDRWLVRRFQVEGTGNDGPFTLIGNMEILELKATLPTDVFKLDPNLVKGFTKSSPLDSGPIPPV